MSPRVSVVIPAYESHHTLPACLGALRDQCFTDFEVVVVDSSPEDHVTPIVASVFPEVRLIRSARRLPSQAARNLGVEHASGALLVFTDPDIYVPPDWLDRLVSASDAGPLVFGSIACHGRKWLDVATHFAKFGVCLPGGRSRAVTLGWSGNVLIERSLFEQVGGWDESFVQGDSVLTARAVALGHAGWFEPSICVLHDHEDVTLGAALRERYRRGREFAALVAAGHLGHAFDAGKLEVARVPLVPARILLNLLRLCRTATRANLITDFLRTLPVTALLVTAWYTGETRSVLSRATAALAHRSG